VANPDCLSPALDFFDTIESCLVSANVDVLEAAISEKAQRNVPLIFKLYETGAG
jgi:hypothetical protein